MKICFVDVSKTDYSFKNLNDEYIRGQNQFLLIYQKISDIDAKFLYLTILNMNLNHLIIIGLI